MCGKPSDYAGFNVFHENVINFKQNKHFSRWDMFLANSQESVIYVMPNFQNEGLLDTIRQSCMAVSSAIYFGVF